MNLPCCAVRDLLPLHADALDSPETGALVEEHLLLCADCRAAAAALNASSAAALPVQGTAPLKAISARLKERRLRIILCALFAGMLLSMLFSWFGGARGVQEIKGLILLLEPAALAGIAALAVGLLIRSRKAGYIVTLCGASCFGAAQLYTFFTWYFATINSEFTLKRCFELAYPEFFVAFAITAAAAAASAAGIALCRKTADK